jgi:DNA-binding IclR family transcriptional regulator
MATRSSPVQRALAVLRALSDPEVRRMSDVARATGLDPATTSRLLDLLVQEGFATRDARRHYGIGPEVFSLRMSGSGVWTCASLRDPLWNGSRTPSAIPQC